MDGAESEHNIAPGGLLPEISFIALDGFDQKVNISEEVLTKVNISIVEETADNQTDNNKSSQSKSAQYRANLPSQYELKGVTFPQKGNQSFIFFFSQIKIIGPPGTVMIEINAEGLSHIAQQQSPEKPQNQEQEKNLRKNFRYRLKVNLRKCLRGEIISYDFFGRILECMECPANQYSLLDPNNNKNLTCKECPANARCYGGSKLYTNPKFWRENELSDEILPCSTAPDNCQGGEGAGEQLCSTNFIGPLCEECDIFNGYTKISPSQCFSCNNVPVAICNDG